MFGADGCVPDLISMNLLIVCDSEALSGSGSRAGFYDTFLSWCWQAGNWELTLQRGCWKFCVASQELLRDNLPLT